MANLLEFRDIDSHYVFTILQKIQISIRHKCNFPYKKAEEYGITKEKRGEKLIVSLTSYPKRISTVHITLNTLLRQRLKPDEIILWLADSQFQNRENDLPEELLELRKFGLQIRWCKDLKSYKKLIPALREYPNDVIITADDDIYYEEDWLENLYRAYIADKKNIYVKRAGRVESVKGKLCTVPTRRHLYKNKEDARFENIIMGGSGCLFPPNSLHKDIFNEEQFLTVIPTHDDIYFWAMAVLQGTKIKIVDGYTKNMCTIEGTQAVGLCKINNPKRGGLSAQNAIDKMCEIYPQITETVAGSSLNIS